MLCSLEWQLDKMASYIDTDDLRTVLNDLVDLMGVMQDVTEGSIVTVDLLGSGRKIKLKVSEVKQSKKYIVPKGDK